MPISSFISECKAATVFHGERAMDSQSTKNDLRVNVLALKFMVFVLNIALKISSAEMDTLLVSQLIVEMPTASKLNGKP